MKQLKLTINYTIDSINYFHIEMEFKLKIYKINSVKDKSNLANLKIKYLYPHYSGHKSRPLSICYFTTCFSQVIIID